MTGHAHHADEEQEDQNDGEKHNDDSIDIEQSSGKEDTTYNVFVKNKQNTSETCRKCTRKILNGVRCRECAEATHWSCAGVPKYKIENTKKELLKGNQWTCSTCTKSKNSTKKNSNQSCAPCKCKGKEIKN